MQLPGMWELPEPIKKRFGQKSLGKQRAMSADGHLLLVLHKVPTSDKRERESILFWRKSNGEWLCSERGEGLHRLRKHLEEYAQAEERFSQAFAHADEADEYFRLLRDLAPVQRSANNLYATLQAARELIPEEQNIIDLRDQAYAIDRTLELLYTDTKNAIDFHIAKMSEEQARLSMQSLHTQNRLNILAAIFFPLTAIASIFGMTLRSGLENAPVPVFWAIFLIGIVLGFLTRGWVTKSK